MCSHELETDEFPIPLAQIEGLPSDWHPSPPRWSDDEKRAILHALFAVFSDEGLEARVVPAGEHGPTILDEIPEERTCAQAGVPRAYCACRRDEQGG